MKTENCGWINWEFVLNFCYICHTFFLVFMRERESKMNAFFFRTEIIADTGTCIIH